MIEGTPISLACQAVGEYLCSLNKKMRVRYDDLGLLAYLGSAKVFSVRGDEVKSYLLGSFANEYNANDPDLLNALKYDYLTMSRLSKSTGILCDYFSEPLVDVKELMSLLGFQLPVQFIAKKYFKDDKEYLEDD